MRRRKKAPMLRAQRSLSSPRPASARSHRSKPVDKVMKPFYDSRHVHAHGHRSGPVVLLMNEAPGPQEAVSGIPSFGLQGANIFHALRNSGIAWASAHTNIAWPQKGEAGQSAQHGLKAKFLEDRSANITSTNAYPKWPKPSEYSSKFCSPADADVLSAENIQRIKREVAPTHRVILICGASAYLACLGCKLPRPASRERTELSVEELEEVNDRLGSSFEKGWYMGHTRRWSLRSSETWDALQEVARYVGWPLTGATGDQ